jgi:hypothetical protein
MRWTVSKPYALELAEITRILHIKRHNRIKLCPRTKSFVIVQVLFSQRRRYRVFGLERAVSGFPISIFNPGQFTRIFEVSPIIDNRYILPSCFSDNIIKIGLNRFVLPIEKSFGFVANFIKSSLFKLSVCLLYNIKRNKIYIFRSTDFLAMQSRLQTLSFNFCRFQNKVTSVQCYLLTKLYFMSLVCLVSLINIFYIRAFSP